MSDITVGTEIPALKFAPINRTTLALYAGASGDHNPIHIDSDFAKKAGMPSSSAPKIEISCSAKIRMISAEMAVAASATAGS